MNPKGFSKFRKKMIPMGKFNFKRDENVVGIYRNKKWDSNLFDDNLGYWKGTACGWDIFDRDLVIRLKSIEKYGFQ